MPGARLLHARRLRGGVSASVHLLEIEEAGTRRRVVLRRAKPGSHLDSPELLEREFRVLRLLQQASVPAPEPLALDTERRYLDVPAMLISYVGRPWMPAGAPDRWLQSMASALAAVHTITPETHDLSFLPTRFREQWRERLAGPLPAHVAGDELALGIMDALARALDSLPILPAALVHNDFWPGNVVWRRAHPAIVDWVTAVVGDPRMDVAQCRIDLALWYGEDAAKRFLAFYEEAAQSPMPDMWFFDLARGVFAYGSYAEWLVGYRDLGFMDTDDAAGARISALLTSSLARAPV
jgi:aminoglycoside phosphotransferase (APT) family kinase protein